MLACWSNFFKSSRTHYKNTNAIMRRHKKSFLYICFLCYSCCLPQRHFFSMFNLIVQHTMWSEMSGSSLNVFSHIMSYYVHNWSLTSATRFKNYRRLNSLLIIFQNWLTLTWNRLFHADPNPKLYLYMKDEMINATSDHTELYLTLKMPHLMHNELKNT